ncbi:MAG: hypothetical protein ABSH32_10675 [Bryobacteraceae bacterium]|jgi:hypothetical protein
MPVWAHRRSAGAKGIPPAVQARTERRILDYAAEHYAGRFTRIDVRFRGAICYIDAYTEPGVPDGYRPPAGKTREEWLQHLRDTPHHLCRIRYFGNEDRWSFAFYTYAHEKYEPSFLLSGANQGAPEEAFATSALFL